MSLGRHVSLKRFDSGSIESDQMELVGDVIELSGIELSGETNENTPYGANESDFRTYEYGLKDGGEISISVRYRASNAQADAFADAFFNSTAEKIQLIFPAAIGQKFEADVLVTKVGIPTGKGDQLNRDFTLKVSGEPLLNAVIGAL
jgi:hypothetical protein